MAVYIARTGSFLPGKPISNDEISQYLGVISGEDEIRDRVLRMNGIAQRHYALRSDQSATHDVYQLACEAIRKCTNGQPFGTHIGYLSSGSTHTPFSGPGLSSLLHGMLAEQGVLSQSVEVNSNSGICTASSTALLNAYRAVASGQHQGAIVVGAERPSEILKSTAYAGVPCPPADAGKQVQAEWFMSAFLRFMLSDGAGAVVLSSEQEAEGLSLRINWGFSRSFAHEAPVCMTMCNRRMLLSQDVDILNRYLFGCTRRFVQMAMDTHQEHLDDYDVVLPHLSSFFFRKRMERTMREFLTTAEAEPPPYWTNLSTAGNTGAASIYVMLDEFVRTQPIQKDDRILLYIPESGQFNFMMFSLTAC